MTALVGAGYFFVWAAFGTAAYPLGVAAAITVERLAPRPERAARAVGAAVIAAGAFAVAQALGAV
ncbi:MAG: hypothetical protein ACHQJD_02955 [Thermoanaerobaculia bacterium]